MVGGARQGRRRRRTNARADATHLAPISPSVRARQKRALELICRIIAGVRPSARACDDMTRARGDAPRARECDRGGAQAAQVYGRRALDGCCAPRSVDWSMGTALLVVSPGKSITPAVD